MTFFFCHAFTQLFCQRDDFLVIFPIQNDPSVICYANATSLCAREAILSGFAA